MAAPSISNGTQQFVSTVSPVLTLSGSGSITTLTQAPGSNKSYDLLFDYEFSEADAKSFLDCFTVSGKGATFAATLASDAAFEALIVKCINNATLTTIADSGKATPTPAGDAGLAMNPWFRKRVIDNIKNMRRLRPLHRCFLVPTMNSTWMAVRILSHLPCL